MSWPAKALFPGYKNYHNVLINKFIIEYSSLRIFQTPINKHIFVLSGPKLLSPNNIYSRAVTIDSIHYIIYRCDS